MAKRILIVDDDTFDCNLIAKSLKDVSAEVNITIVNDSRDALAQFCLVKPDLTLLDIMMPDMDGFDVMETLRDLPERQQCSIFFFSTSTSRLDQERARQLGADGYHCKLQVPAGHFLSRY